MSYKNLIAHLESASHASAKNDHLKEEKEEI